MFLVRKSSFDGHQPSPVIRSFQYISLSLTNQLELVSVAYNPRHLVDIKGVLYSWRIRGLLIGLLECLYSLGWHF
jgi:hypothetical protein